MLLLQKDVPNMLQQLLKMLLQPLIKSIAQLQQTKNVHLQCATQQLELKLSLMLLLQKDVPNMQQ